ncbi:MAG TPA: histidinol-phosphatase [Acidimicrobiia bacterium]|nr:histidinol-phosphatase [Acidimicrobiia bacterium]
MAGDLADDLALALELADMADAITTARFRARDLVVATKPDMTPVSEADHATEEALRAALAQARPDDGLLGEELGTTEGISGRRWIIDPIDGTKSYVRGIPVWSTLLALETSEGMDLGLVSAPALGQRWWAVRGGGAFRNGEPISVSGITTIEDAHLSYDSVSAFDAAGLTDQFLALTRRCWRSRGFGDFWQYALVAEGALDIAVESHGPRLWDLAPLLVLVEEAGGRFTDLAGVPTADGGNAVATNGQIHDAVLAALRK